MVEKLEQQLKQAQEAEAEGRLEDAFALYRDMQITSPANVDVLYHFGCLAHSTGNFQAAWQMFIQGLGHAPSDARLHLGLGKARGALNDWAGAIRALETANRLEPENTDVLVHLATACHETGAFEDSLAYCDQAIKLAPKIQLAKNIMGSALMHLGQHDKAVDVFRTLTAESPDDGQILFNLGNACHCSGQYDDALKAYRKATELMPDDIEAHLILGAVAYDLDSPGLAKEAFAAAAKLDPDKIDAHAGLARALVQLGQNSQAVATYDRALKLSPGNSTFLFERSAATKARINAAPEDYVIETFDAMAETFDEHLVDVLEYRVPDQLRDAVGAVVGASNPGWSIVDLGCGTGLCGLLFRDLAKHMLGVDLSPSMIRQSEACGAYDELRVESVNDTLRAANQAPDTAFDLIVAADLFIYIGNLDPIFEGCIQALKPRGYFVFSTENTSSKDFTVNANMRFAQSADYIRDLAKKYSFKIISAEQSALRMEMRKPVMGTIYLLQKDGDTG